MPTQMPPMMPPSTAMEPLTMPATMPTSSMPEICLAAIAATMTGRMPTSASNTLSSAPSPGILPSARHRAMAMKPGMEAIMMPRKLMRFQTLPSSAAAFFELPITGRYLRPHSLEKAAIAETARVRFVVPVVPEAAITLQPMVCTSAIELPPVPATGMPFSCAAESASWLMPFGSQLMSMMPSISPARISSASCVS